MTTRTNNLIGYTVIGTGDMAFPGEDAMPNFQAFVADLMEEAPQTVVYWDNVLYLSNINPRHLTATHKQFTIQFVNQQRKKWGHPGDLIETTNPFVVPVTSSAPPTSSPPTSSPPTSSPPTSSPPTSWAPGENPDIYGYLLAWVSEATEDSNAGYGTANTATAKEFGQLLRDVQSDPRNIIVYRDSILNVSLVPEDLLPYLVHSLLNTYTFMLDYLGIDFDIYDENGNGVIVDRQIVIPLAPIPTTTTRAPGWGTNQESPNEH